MKLIQEVSKLLDSGPPGEYCEECGIFKTPAPPKAFLELFVQALEDQGHTEAADWVRDETFILVDCP